MTFCFVSAFVACTKKDSSNTSSTSDQHAPVNADSVVIKSISPDKVKALAKNGKGEWTVLNVWASWCLPCREEFPQILKFRSDWLKKDVRTIFLSADFPKDVSEAKSFLAEKKVDFETFIREGDDQALINGLDPQWSGALPTTFILDAAGKILYRFDGEVTEKKLEEKILALKNGGGAKPSAGERKNKK